MNKKNPIEQKLIQNIFDQNVIFVFSTGLSADLWADRATKITQATAVATERFMAWDDFKSKSIRGQKQDKTSVPSTLRDIFAANIILQNGEKQFLKNLIVPKFAKESSGFTNWISSLLPGLRLWGEKKLCEIEPNQKEAVKTIPTEEILKKLSQNAESDFFDDEDCDFLEIFNRYNNFLNQNALFDPAWETPPFKADGKKYILFYPEILSDWIEYENILKSSPEIEIVNVPEADSTPPSVDFYKNSRSEIRNVALYLRNLHDKKGVLWTDIAVNVPDLENYAPYIQRDFKIYGIPNNLRNGKNLSESGAGALFRQILECVQNKFSFESVKKLLLNSELPWLDGELNSQLIEFGKINNCICSYEYAGKVHDSWEEAFKLKGEGYSRKHQRLLHESQAKANGFGFVRFI
ncbi:exodeoxyribonuclease V subunit gamma [Treponema zioleckii]|uniref:exodeoxyribonuclease V subunit gamma n=1 Tax=Treponema zioleckii TaxID=331680 RepID=UPI00168BD602|nr:exodeoxyribonuclease V subunit gamma [Treponema zioleckii]